MLEKLKEIQTTALAGLESMQDEAALESWRVMHLGRNSELMQLFNGFGQLTKEERPVIGQRANEVKKALEAAFSASA
jgi:phenylalanyl-tRNA synthetase alpha chain